MESPLTTGATVTAGADVDNTPSVATVQVSEPSPALTVNPTPDASPDEWRGDARYFQTGKKQGRLKPPIAPSGLDYESLKITQGAPAANASTAQAAPSEPNAAEVATAKKSADAKVAAKLVMRALDMLVGIISGGQFGRDFTAQQNKDRNAYRDELDRSWAEYLATLDVAMPPVLVALVGSIIYVSPALETPRGKERVASLSEKIFGKIGAMMWSKRK